MKVGLLDVQLAELFRRNLPAYWIGSTIQSSTHHKTTTIGGIADQVDHGLVSAQRPAAPID
jgi:hypothetical protein